MLQGHSFAAVALVRGGESTLSRCARADNGQSVLVKVPRSRHPEQLERMRHELLLGQHLGLSPILRPLELEDWQGQPALVFEDFPGEPLERWLKAPQPVPAFLALAIKIADAVAAVHERGVIHKGLTPDSILVHPATGDVRLADFDRAVLASREPAVAAAAHLIEGSLPHLAPEQTGWMNRAVDARSDLYALGVIYHQLLTGRLPFEAKDPLEWVHCHVARAPRPLSESDRRIPAMLSDVVMRLLAKRAEDRYQSARGLRHDLEACRDRLDEAGRIESFTLGSHDFSDRLQVAQQLYGREEARAALLDAFARVEESGAAQLVLLTGASGVGKSALAGELQRPVIERHGYFLAGKFDEYNRNVPYATVAQAFRGVVLELLGGTDAELGLWRRRLQAAVGAFGRPVVELIPSLELVIGAQPAPPELPQAEAQRCLWNALRGFVVAFATAERPLVLFLDDLQWADSASLAWLGDFIASVDVRQVLVVAAYRSNEVGSAHPLRLTLDRLRGARVPVTDVPVPPLEARHVTALLADTLRCSPDEARPLGRLAHAKTAGNPFFVRQFLSEIHQDGLLWFDPNTTTWRWDLERIFDRRITENVVDLVSQRLRRLPPRTQHALRLAASLGTAVELDVLALVTGATADQLRDDLQVAISEGAVCRQGSTCRFQHDRVHQAAYALIPEEERARVHLASGRLLRARLRDDDPPEQLFEATDQLNRGASLLDSFEERRELAALNRKAGQRARGAGAFGLALDYATAGLRLLPAEAWQSDRALAFGLSFDRAQGHLLASSYEEAERLARELMVRAESRLERARLHALLADAHTKRGQFPQVIAEVQEGLALYGVTLPAAPTEADLAAEEEALTREIGARAIEDLQALPVVRDEDLEVAARLFTTVLPTAYFINPPLHRMVALQFLLFSLRHGMTPASPTGLTAWGFELCISGRYEEAHRFGRVGRALVDQHALVACRPHVYIMATATTDAFSRPFSELIASFDQTFRGLVEIGDLVYAGFAASWLPLSRLIGGRHLDEILERAQAAVDFLQRAGDVVIGTHVAIVRNLTRSLRDPGRERMTLDSPELGERQFEATVEPVTLPLINLVYYFCKTQTRFFERDLEGALAAARKAEVVLSAYRGQLGETDVHTHCALAEAAALDRVPLAERGELEAAIARHLDYLAVLAKHCPANFLNRHALVAAELARHEGQDARALDLYQISLRASQESGQLQFEALAHELAGRHHLARGRSTAARAHLAEARAAYERWGAGAKVAALDKELGALFPAASPAGSPPTAVRPEQFDALAASKASQAISGQIERDDLVTTLLTVAREQAGAARAVLLVERDGELVEEAQDPPGAAGGLPLVMVRGAWRARETLVLDAAVDTTAFARDPYLAEVAPRSVLCLPILRQGAAVGLLYLENRLVAGLFTPGRLAALELIAAQAAISLDNASLVRRERQARAAAEAAERRAAFLSEATALLSESLDHETVLARLARLAVGSLAEWCLIDLIEGGEIRRLAGAHADPAREAVLAELQRRYPARWGSPQPAVAAIASGRARLFAEVTEHDLERNTVDDEHRDLVRALGLASALVVPIKARGHTLGAITMSRGGRAPRFDALDLALGEQLAERAAIAIENSRLYRRSQEAIRLRDEFLTVASHELSTPVATFMLNLEGLAGAPGADPAAIAAMARRALGPGRRLSRLVNDLLDVSRIERGQLALAPERVDLGILLESVLVRFRPELERGRCELTSEIAPGIVGQWDPVRLEQVVFNLLSNAVKFGAKAPVHVGLERAPAGARLTVRDHGIGIAEADRERIFDRFARAVSTVNFGGLGLGLYICRRIAEAHGGTISVDSQPGKGATFRVLLPFGS